MDAFEVILKTGEPAELSVVRSLLEAAGIPCVVDGEGVQDLFGVGRLGAGYNILTGPVRVKVPTERAAEARALLAEALSDVEDGVPESDDEDA